ncbi:MAG: peptidoglycan bridge formation glycyltransferase FemA/FemB family protein, partial [Candidatus Yanofskybacteria bacterium]|nr:peptidoglycan bridge formation glycyltransferase FemA/FemB family protein [Candidatus Yanofskybacteria bacterium]
MNKSFLQTKEWLDFQESIGHKTWRFPSTGSGQVDSGIRANIIQHKVAFGKNYLYIPHGPVVDFSNAQSAKPEAIEKFTTGHGPEMLTKNFQVQVK